MTYVSRIRKNKDDKDKEEKRSKSKPGSGNCWKKGITISQEFNLLTENSNRKENKQYLKSQIKSLQMPIELNKFTNHRNTESNYNQSVQFTQTSNRNEPKQKLSEIKLDKSMTYEKAMSYLHNALASLDI